MNHSKNKARDIIPGWPRGRSVASVWSLRRYEPETFWLGTLFYSDADKYEFGLEWEYEKTYHEMQQAMVNEFHRDGKAYYYKYTEPLFLKALPGEIGNLAGFSYVDNYYLQAEVLVEDAVRSMGYEKWLSVTQSFESLGFDSLALAALYVEIEGRVGCAFDVTSLDAKSPIEFTIVLIAKVVEATHNSSSKSKTSLKTPGNAGK